MISTRLEFYKRTSFLFLGATLLLSCSLATEDTRQPPFSPSQLISQTVARVTSTSDLASFATSTQTPAQTQILSPSPTLTPISQFQLPGRFILVADGEISMVTASCMHSWDACTTTWIKLTNTPRPEQQFAAEIIRDPLTASPDGKKIAFAYRQTSEYQGLAEGGWDIYVLDIDTCQRLADGCESQMITRLTGDPFDEISPAWAPDGSLIAFTSNQGPFESFLNPYGLFVMRTDGSSQERVISDETPIITSSIFDPAWSPDSLEIVFSVMTSQYRHPDVFIYTAKRDGSEAKQLTSLPHEENLNKTDSRPQWSPDGTQILFESNRDKPPGLYLMDTDGVKITRLEVNEQASLPYWSPDGTMIAFLYSSGLAVLERQSGHIFDIILEHQISSFIWIK